MLSTKIAKATKMRSGQKHCSLFFLWLLVQCDYRGYKIDWWCLVEFTNYIGTENLLFNRPNKWVDIKQGTLKGDHCTVDLLFDLFGLVCFANKNKNFKLSYSWFQTSQTGGQQCSVPCIKYKHKCEMTYFPDWCLTMAYLCLIMGTL